MPEKPAAVLERPKPRPTSPTMEFGTFLAVVPDAARQVNMAKDREERSALGQFLTPMNIASLMAGMFDDRPGCIRLLDPGAGAGALTSAFVVAMAGRKNRPARIEATCYEIDPSQLPMLRASLEECAKIAERAGIALSIEVRTEDFLEAGVIEGKLAFGQRYDAVIMNPPYKKIGTGSRERLLLRSAGIETVNLYTAFMAVAVQLLEVDGQFVAISPRSFCNGLYYRTFRCSFVKEMAFRRIHVFAQRNSAFGDDAVLQENVIVHAVRRPQRDDAPVTISESIGLNEARSRETCRASIVKPSDPEKFIHIDADEESERVTKLFDKFKMRLSSLGLRVSTGPVVDFRLKSDLSVSPAKGFVPLFWPANCRQGTTRHPVDGSKPQWIRVTEASERWLTPNECFVLVKRFSSKEERRRVVAIVHEPASVSGDVIGLENHLNYIHLDGRGLTPDLAHGIAAFLNSGLLDSFFRQFNGNTQVNATDLRMLPFPTVEVLEDLGRLARNDVTNPTWGDDLIQSFKVL